MQLHLSRSYTPTLEHGRRIALSITFLNDAMFATTAAHSLYVRLPSLEYVILAKFIAPRWKGHPFFGSFSGSPTRHTSVTIQFKVTSKLSCQPRFLKWYMSAKVMSVIAQVQGPYSWAYKGFFASDAQPSQVNWVFLQTVQGPLLAYRTRWVFSMKLYSFILVLPPVSGFFSLVWYLADLLVEAMVHFLRIVSKLYPTLRTLLYHEMICLLVLARCIR
ncbi:hypothetical protein HD554DRAFT_748165 [Boletus coccyginus]|nr:hypothetical protein HD554DRAFT_748165 [Boletus coccyginus]